MEKPASTPTTESNEISDQEIADIYKEVDGTPDDENDNSETPEKEAADESQPDEDQKDDEAADPEGVVEDDPDGEPEKEAVDPLKKPEVVEDQKDEATRAQEIQDHAIKHSLTYAQAKEDLEKTEAVIKNYKTPQEIARALRSTQSELDRIKNEAAKKDAPQVFARMNDDQFLAADRERLEENKEKIVAEARRKRPAQTETMTDEAILEEVAYKRLDAYKTWADRQEGELRTKASEVRDQLIATIPAEDKQFIPDIKSILSKTSDRHVLSPDFDIKDLLYHARGQRYYEYGSEQYQLGLKKGREQPKIIGQIGGTTGGGGQKPKAKTTSSAGLSEGQKARAEEMFPAERGYTAEEAYSEFRDTYKDELKKNPKFIY